MVRATALAVSFRAGSSIMPNVQSAGVLLYRWRGDRLEVLLVHPGGPFWSRKDEGAWSIPKGEFSPDEAPAAAARREFEEEVGVALQSEPWKLTPVAQSRGKTVHAFAAEGDLDVAHVRSNLVSMEWPPRSGRTLTFPEIDRAAWFALDEAQRRILKGQRPILDELRERLTTQR
jgi:predicted NUDIX family NTP pyrophosphohydrolase